MCTPLKSSAGFADPLPGSKPQLVEGDGRKSVPAGHTQSPETTTMTVVIVPAVERVTVLTPERCLNVCGSEWMTVLPPFPDGCLPGTLCMEVGTGAGLTPSRSDTDASRGKLARGYNSNHA